MFESDLPERFDSSSVFEVTYAVDHFAYSAGDVGLGTRIRDRGQLNPHSLGRRCRALCRQPFTGTEDRLAH
jgi:hypothetical protein